VIDVGSKPENRPVITLRLEQIARVLGIVIEPAEVTRILVALGLEPAGGPPEAPRFRPPSWRADLEREVDLIEEVARIHGYEHIPEDRPVPLASSPRGPRERVEEEVRSLLTNLGFDEAVTFSFVSEGLVGPMTAGSGLPPIVVDHSTRRLENALRQSLVPSLLVAGQPLPDEPTHLAIVSGRDYFGLKGIVEALLARLHLDGDLEVKAAESSWLTQGRSAELALAGEPLGRLGEVDRARLDQLDLKTPCSAVELSLNLLVEKADLVPRHRPLPPFPAVARDLSLVVPRSLAWSDLAAIPSGPSRATRSSNRSRRSSRPAVENSPPRCVKPKSRLNRSSPGPA
jgi:phenylalanyl-tRNA synthetase beta chain